MTAPRLVNLHDRRQALPADVVYIDRRSKWGNPFLIGPDGSRMDVVRKHREWLHQQPTLLAALPELRGRTLACWCSPALCHGNTLLDLAALPDSQVVEPARRKLQAAAVAGPDDPRAELHALWDQLIRAGAFRAGIYASLVTWLNRQGYAVGSNTSGLSDAAAREACARLRQWAGNLARR